MVYPKRFAEYSFCSLGNFAGQLYPSWNQTMVLSIQQIRQFVDRPRQRSKCYKFNHLSGKCQSEQLCVTCSLQHTGPCTAAVKCVNCGESHKSDYLQCPFPLERSGIFPFLMWNLIKLLLQTIRKILETISVFSNLIMNCPAKMSDQSPGCKQAHKNGKGGLKKKKNPLFIFIFCLGVCYCKGQFISSLVKGFLLSFFYILNLYGYQHYSVELP